jgi:hypothetical protein
MSSVDFLGVCEVFFLIGIPLGGGLTPTGRVFKKKALLLLPCFTDLLTSRYTFTDTVTKTVFYCSSEDCLIKVWETSQGKLVKTLQVMYQCIISNLCNMYVLVMMSNYLFSSQCWMAF